MLLIPKETGDRGREIEIEIDIERIYVCVCAYQEDKEVLLKRDK
jgi:hypothetical protein